MDFLKLYLLIVCVVGSKLPFDVYENINRFIDSATSDSLRQADKFHYNNLQLNGETIFLWYKSCLKGSIHCSPVRIQEFYSKHVRVLDPERQLAQTNEISVPDLIGLLVRQQEFTPYNYYTQSYYSTDPLTFCIKHQMNDCIRILRRRHFYVENVQNATAFVNGDNPFLDDMQRNTEYIREHLIPSLNQVMLNSYFATQLVRKQPIDQVTMSTVLLNVAMKLNNTNAVNLGVWMLNNHLNALSETRFHRFVAELLVYNSNATPIAKVMKEVLQTKYEMHYYDKIKLFKVLIGDHDFVKNESATLLDILKSFPYDGDLIYNITFTKSNHFAYNLLKNSKLFSVERRKQKLTSFWQSLFYTTFGEKNSTESFELLLSSIEDVDISWTIPVDWIYFLELLAMSTNTARFNFYKKLFAYFKNTNDTLFTINFHNQSLDNVKGSKFLRILIELCDGVPKPELLLMKIFSKKMRYSIERSFKLIIPFVKGDRDKVDVLKSLLVDVEEDVLSDYNYISCFNMVLQSIVEPSNNEEMLDLVVLVMKTNNERFIRSVLAEMGVRIVRRSPFLHPEDHSFTKRIMIDTSLYKRACKIAVTSNLVNSKIARILLEAYEGWMDFDTAMDILELGDPNLKKSLVVHLRERYGNLDTIASHSLE
ncbi:hypothetical protein O9G_001071 [Rozella allomycis CSF55]|uniref:Uncharacterized protein n=1 Tax=Rozella allomycis (strain CSF55) TaxID=988480 RepID=A0A075AR29_ROZAC|nr:hypothetical protein O9G_001071 [Rozella allomycis CSF55]|eukprot:EPZ31160.1 hypothetical protein O9G_001071 [Rozella allomycis CSF55]